MVDLAMYWDAKAITINRAGRDMTVLQGERL